MKNYWLSSKKMTFGVTVVDGKVMDAAPIARKFVGQPIKVLMDWMRRQGCFKSFPCNPFGSLP